MGKSKVATILAMKRTSCALPRVSNEFGWVKASGRSAGLSKSNESYVSSTVAKLLLQVAWHRLPIQAAQKKGHRAEAGAARRITQRRGSCPVGDLGEATNRWREERSEEERSEEEGERKEGQEP